MSGISWTSISWNVFSMYFRGLSRQDCCWRRRYHVITINFVGVGGSGGGIS